MVKRQKEKLYQSQSEYSRGGARGASSSNGTVQRLLPFHCCALSLVPFENPVCTPNGGGVIFESTALLPFVMEHKKDPVTGDKLATRDIITLHMDRDEESGKWQCPVLTKPFQDHSKIVAIRNGKQDANVYSFEAYQELNVKAKNWTDLVSGQPFSRSKDVLVLFDPSNEEFNTRRDINNFYHTKHARSLNSTSANSDINVQNNVTAMSIMNKLAKGQKEREEKQGKTNIFQKSTKVALKPSLTSTTDVDVPVEIDNTEEKLVALFKIMRRRKKKGYVTLETTLGKVGLELHCDIAPRACTNFLGLASQGKYDGTKIHRLIPKFMIQCGRDKRDDHSLWGGPFRDEFDDRLKHDVEGVLSMANSGPNTNKRQFFITFKPTPHLDKKHSVFGRVVDGMDVVKELEKVPTDKKDRPVHELHIVKIHILVNPVKEAEEQERERTEESAKNKKRPASAISKKESNHEKPPSPSKPMIGKYMKQAMKPSLESLEGQTTVTRLAPPPKTTKFQDFSGW